MTVLSMGLKMAEENYAGSTDSVAARAHCSVRYGGGSGFLIQSVTYCFYHLSVSCCHSKVSKYGDLCSRLFLHLGEVLGNSLPPVDVEFFQVGLKDILKALSLLSSSVHFE